MKAGGSRRRPGGPASGGPRAEGLRSWSLGRGQRPERAGWGWAWEEDMSGSLGGRCGRLCAVLEGGDFRASRTEAAGGRGERRALGKGEVSGLMKKPSRRRR